MQQNPLYSVILFFIDCFKWIEDIFFRLIRPIAESRVKENLKRIGVNINGSNPIDVQVLHKDYYVRLASETSLGAGESYMDEWWECKDMEEMVFRTFRYNLYTEMMSLRSKIKLFIVFKIFNLQTKARSWEVGEKHYDIGNDLFEAMLDSEMNYSCGYWRNAKNLEEAQQNKMELIAKKLKLEPGMKVLDIGCGWGGLCKYLAKNYGVDVVGITISKEGAKFGRERCKDLPVDIRLMDYRDLNEKFDRIVSVGMFEHVGESNYKTFFEVANRCLADDGLFLLHTIGINHDNMPFTEPWTHKYIFPNGQLPYYRHIAKYTEGLFIIEDWHNFGPDYCKTLRAWLEKFEKAWPRFSAEKGEKFYRMWTYYLKLAAAGFRARRFQLWQVVLSKDGIVDGYESVR